MRIRATPAVASIAALMLALAPLLAAAALAPGDVCTPLEDASYDGSLASMSCLEVPGPELEITDLEVQIASYDTWVGELTFKVLNPDGQALTLMSRPGLDEPADDGSWCCGDSSNLKREYPVLFDDQATVSAEDMGATIDGFQSACRDDGVCELFPFPDTGPGTSLADFNGQSAAGTWRVCVGDSQGGDVGAVCSAALVFNDLAGDLELEQSAPDGVAFPPGQPGGGAFDLLLRAFNHGPADQSEVEVTHHLSPDLEILADDCGGTLAGDVWNWQIGDLAAGAAAECRLSARLEQAACGPVINVARVSGLGGDLEPANDYAVFTNAQSQSITDGSFEHVRSDGTWDVTPPGFGGPLCVYWSCQFSDTQHPRTGAWWLRFGSNAAPVSGSARQTVIIEPEAELDLWLQIPGPCDSPDDYLEVRIDGTAVLRIDGSSPLCGSPGYTRQRADVSAFADGGSHDLEIYSETFFSGGSSTRFFVDDVSLARGVCQEAVLPPVVEIPALGTGGLAALLLALAGAGIRSLRRRRPRA